MHSSGKWTCFDRSTEKAGQSKTNHINMSKPEFQQSCTKLCWEEGGGEKHTPCPARRCKFPNPQTKIFRDNWAQDQSSASVIFGVVIW